MLKANPQDAGKISIAFMPKNESRRFIKNKNNLIG
jgi:hypothetical protein